jgi:hypothetical protein
MIFKDGITKEEKAKKLIEELQRMESERSNFEDDWKDAQALVSSVQLSFPATAEEDVQGYRIPKRMTDRASNYMETLVSGLCGYGINPNIKWINLELFDQKLMNAYGVRDWLSDVMEAIYKEMDNDNLYTESPMMVESAATFGYGAIQIEDDYLNNKVRYKYINTNELYLNTNEFDEFDTVFRRFFMTIENAISKFGLENMAQKIKDRYKTLESGGDLNSYLSQKMEILHCVYRRKDKEGSSSHGEMPYASIFVDVTNKFIISEEGYRTMPYAIFAWSRIGGVKYPVSPAIKAVNDISLLNEMEDTRLTVAQKSANPAMNVPSTMKGAENFGPGGYNYYNDKSPTVALASQVQAGANYPITLEITNDMSARIKDWFFVDFFLMLQQQADISKMTATAVQALQGEKASVMTNMVVNLQKALQVIVSRTFDIMMRQGRLPDLPPSMIGKGTSMKFVYSSVLAQILQAALRYQGVPRFINNFALPVANLGRIFPPVMNSLYRYDWDYMGQIEARAANLPEKAILEDDDVARILTMIQQQQAAQQQAAMQQQAAQAEAQSYGQLAKAPERGSPADEMMQQSQEAVAA